MHVNEFLRDGYRLSAESIECKFPVCDGSRRILPKSTGISDGYSKLMLMTGIMAIIHSLDTWLQWEIETQSIPMFLSLESAPTKFEIIQ